MAPDFNQMSQIIDDLGVDILCTPTAIKTLAVKNDKVVEERIVEPCDFLAV